MREDCTHKTDARTWEIYIYIYIHIYIYAICVYRVSIGVFRNNGEHEMEAHYRDSLRFPRIISDCTNLLHTVEHFLPCRPDVPSVYSA